MGQNLILNKKEIFDWFIQKNFVNTVPFLLKTAYHNLLKTAPLYNLDWNLLKLKIYIITMKPNHLNR